MKQKFLLLTLLVAAAVSQLFAQAPQGINYQAVVRNSSGQPVSNNTPVVLKFSIHNTTATGTVVFTENVNVTANQFGLVTTTIGSSGNLATVNWANGDKFLQVEANVNNGGFIDMGTTQLMSVPYALYAANSAPGPQGPQGVTGPQGPIGVTGAQGVQGTTGVAGPQGATGDTGAQGIQGPAGPQGTQGVTGPTGDAGPQGTQGIQGVAGAQGPQGVAGATGATGDTGAQGIQGPAGPQGTQGVAGPAGAQGPAGATGDTGAQGIQGPAGAQGPQGTAGAQGPQGSAGPQGVQGVAGPTGPTGLQGLQGAQGNVGPIGPQGPQGPAGAQGPQGNVGAQGPQGPAGPQGPQGAQGPQGNVGAQGVQGPQGPAGPTWSISSLAFNNTGSLSINTSQPATVTSTNFAWLLGGNNTTATTNIGTTSNQHVDFVTNGAVRGRFVNSGGLFWGTTTGIYGTEIFQVVSNATFPWAINGISYSDGSGVYGEISGGATAFAAVQGEYNGTNVNGAGVRGIAVNPSSIGVLGAETTQLGWAGYFLGDVNIVAGYGLYNISDARLKANIQPINGAVKKLQQLGGYEYDYNMAEYGKYIGKNNHSIGVMAQEVEKVFPELVIQKNIPTAQNAARGTETSGEYTQVKAVNYTGLIPVLIEAVKEQQRQIEAQQKEIDALKARLEGGKN